MNRLGTKAETLQMLYRKLKYADVLPQYSFTVIDSYDDYNEENQVLVQPMLSNVRICGVAFLFVYKAESIYEKRNM